MKKMDIKNTKKENTEEPVSCLLKNLEEFKNSDSSLQQKINDLSKKTEIRDDEPAMCPIGEEQRDMCRLYSEGIKSKNILQKSRGTDQIINLTNSLRQEIKKICAILTPHITDISVADTEDIYSIYLTSKDVKTVLTDLGRSE